MHCFGTVHIVRFLSPFSFFPFYSSVFDNRVLLFFIVKTVFLLRNIPEGLVRNKFSWKIKKIFWIILFFCRVPVFYFLRRFKYFSPLQVILNDFHFIFWESDTFCNRLNFPFSPTSARGKSQRSNIKGNVSGCNEHRHPERVPCVVCICHILIINLNWNRSL
jgi:hypothetical protein